MKAHKGEVPHCYIADSAAGIKQGSSVCMRNYITAHLDEDTGGGDTAKLHPYSLISGILNIAG